jgi:hypothetical protein
VEWVWTRYSSLNNGLELEPSTQIIQVLFYLEFDNTVYQFMPTLYIYIYIYIYMYMYKRTRCSTVPKPVIAHSPPVCLRLSSFKLSNKFSNKYSLRTFWFPHCSPCPAHHSPLDITTSATGICLYESLSSSLYTVFQNFSVLKIIRGNNTIRVCIYIYLYMIHMLPHVGVPGTEDRLS